MPLQKLSEITQLEEVLQNNKTFLLLKNSTTCPISHEAYRQVEKLSEELAEETIYFLNVQEARPLSNEIAARYSVKHESPQLLQFKNGTVTWHASHWNITHKALKELY